MTHITPLSKPRHYDAKNILFIHNQNPFIKCKYRKLNSNLISKLLFYLMLHLLNKLTEHINLFLLYVCMFMSLPDYRHYC